MLRSWEGAMAMSWSNFWVLFTPHCCRVCGPVTQFFGWVCPFKIPRKPWISSRVHYCFWWVRPFKIPRKLRRSPSSEIFWMSPSFKIPRNCGKIRISRIFGGPLKFAGNHRKSKFWNLFIAGKLQRIFGWAHPSKSQDTAEKSAFQEFLGPLKIAGNCRKIQNFKTCTLQENHKKSKFSICSLFLAKNFPAAGEPSHLPLVSPHICLQITKDVRSQRLTVCCHSVGLSTKNEQELRLGLESMVKIIDPSPLPIPNQQSKMLLPSTVT